MLVTGFAATANRFDEIGRVFTVEALANACSASIGLPVRVKHLKPDEAPEVGEVVDVAANRIGLFVVCRLHDTTIRRWVRSGLLNRFSIAGQYWSDANIITDINIEEISVSDLASLPGTRFIQWQGRATPKAAELIKTRKELQ